MNSYIADPLSRKKIRQLVSKIRYAMGLSPEDYFDVVRFLEFYLHEVVPDFHIEVVPIVEMPNQYALTFPKTKCIKIREDVYDGAIAGNARDRFTIAHEIGHLWLHRPGNLALARNSSKEDIPAYKDPEWQANTFAAELLLPPEGTQGLLLDEIVARYGVSYQVGNIQIKNR